MPQIFQNMNKEQNNIPEAVLSYAKHLARNGFTMGMVRKTDVDRLRGNAIEAIKRYREANAEFHEEDEEKNKTIAWLNSIGVDFKKPESCNTQ